MTRQTAIITTIAALAGASVGFSVAASSSAKTNSSSLRCEKIELWTQYNEVEFLAGKPVLKNLPPAKISLALSKDGQLPPRLLVRNIGEIDTRAIVRVESSDKKTRSVGTFVVKKSETTPGFFELAGFESQKTFESLGLEDRLHIEFEGTEKPSCLKTFAYHTDHGDH